MPTVREILRDYWPELLAGIVLAPAMFVLTLYSGIVLLVWAGAL